MCLDWILIGGRRQLEQVVRAYVVHHVGVVALVVGAARELRCFSAALLAALALGLLLSEVLPNGGRRDPLGELREHLRPGDCGCSALPVGAG